MERITTEEVMDKLDMFQSRFGKIDEFGWWYLEIISVDASTQFTSMDFQDECQTRGVCLTLASTEILSKYHQPNSSIFPNLD